jgi:cytochrome c peroxidase
MVDHKEMRGETGTNEIASASSEIEAWDLLMTRILANPDYKKSLEELFPQTDLNIAHVANAIAHFQEQAFFSGDTNYDRYLRGDSQAMTLTQKEGMDIFFGKGRCGQCHRGEHLSDFSYQNVGIPQIGPGVNGEDDLGRFHIDPIPSNLYAFKVPALRNVSLTAPYMHDGVFKTLEEVIEHYDDIESSLVGYFLVDDYKNYVEKLSGPLHATNYLKLSSLSIRLNKKLHFDEREERVLLEFLEGALTDNRFFPK